MAVFEPERCYSCKKLFCCEDCCASHIKSKHPSCESDCPICRYEPLIIRNFDHEPLLGHVVYNHLPLHCRTCGELFENVEDLKTIGKCGRHPLIHVQAPTFIESIRSTSSINTPSPLNKTPHQSSSIDRKGMSIGGNYNCNFDEFTSPPELSRGTSTPMHVGITRKNHHIQNRTIPKIPNVMVTTPSFSIGNDSEKDNISVRTPKSYVYEADSVYYSGQSSIKSNISADAPLKSILSMKSTPAENDRQHNNSKKLSDRRLASMEELDEDAVDMELTNAVGAIFTENVTPPTASNSSKFLDLKDSVKKVRFIDQLINGIETESKYDVSEVEEFFEAPQSFSELSVSLPRDVNMNQSSTYISGKNNCMSGQKKFNDVIDHENKQRNENGEPMENQTPSLESTSRVVMMVLVEQTSDSVPTDLIPLIDSGLKKLESVLSKSTSLQNNPTDSIKHEVKNIASGIESIPQKNPSSTTNANLPGSGIFSAVANAVRNAFRSFSGVTLTQNSMKEASSPPKLSQLPLTPSSNASSKTSRITANSTMNSLSRPGKRSREEVDVIPFELPEVSDIQTERSDHPNEIRSPLQKRPCGWYRQIRGREPIARMKSSFSSPRGISSERQCFQLGSLTVRDTVVPLPSRAHQSTQTD